MNIHSRKTDNADLSSKINLRKHAIINLQEVRVLDLFAGDNVLWGTIGTDYYFGIEKEQGKGKNLYADNTKIIPRLDLSKFNVIDCDSYGVPIKQIMQIYENPTLQKNTIIIYTCISNAMSVVNKELIEKHNLKNIYKKAKAIINRKHTDLFHNYLYEKGVKSVTGYTTSGSFYKEYAYFTT